MAHSPMGANLVLWSTNVLPDFDYEKIRREIIAIPETQNINEVGTVYSTYYLPDLNSRPEVVMLDFYKELLLEATGHLGLNQCQFGLNYWCQVYDGLHDAHDHYGPETLLSFVHFINPVRDCFQFLDSNEKVCYPKQEPGDFIIFPSWASHRVDASYGKDRMVIAGNLHFDYIRSMDGNKNYKNTSVRQGLTVTEKIDGPY